jgi:1,4-dihydroxy-6-naphthoate synthase
MQDLKKIKNITVAHSPDADDIFMYYAIKFGWLNLENTQFQNTALDIETLNIEALKNSYDISAISFALYPKIRNDYALLNTAMSFGEGYGPKLIKKIGKNLKPNFKVALSGENTTNAMLFKIFYPKARIKYFNFLEIENAVLNDEVDAGVLIHESILNFSEQLEVEKEIWDIWQELSKSENLPLPLGGMAIRRSLPLSSAINYQKILIDAVDIAVKYKDLLSKMLLERKLVRIDAQELNKYLNLYANSSSVALNLQRTQALDKLFEIGFNHNFFDSQIKTEDFLIPDDYNRVRFS